MDQRTVGRIVVDFTVVLGVLYAPWYVVVLMTILGVFAFPLFVEVFVVGALYDGLYGTGDTMVVRNGGVAVALGVFLVAEVLRSTIALMRRD